MRFLCFIIIIVPFLVDTYGKTAVKELSEHQINRICSKVSKMRSMSQSESEIIEFLGEDIKRMARKNSRQESSGQVKGYPLMGDDQDEQKVDIKSDDMIGKSGQLFELKMIGTDSSTNTFNNLIRFQQSNDNVREADYSGSIVNLNLQASTKLGQSNQFHNIWYPKLTKNTGKNYPAYDKCLNMIETVYNQQNHKIRESNEDYSLRRSQLLSDSILHRSSYGVVENSTSIDSKLSIGPDGFGTYISHVGRGEATNNAAGSEIDNQVHGNYKNSKVLLTDVTLSPIINL
ncbi:uncharacterized protein LOC141849291 isoform X2 [Brevipalpus obovatus]|uniref:uncharacterized protein LOC141849291 isoform X2 n=1 Tax=Brevipalpus obovatus TaxID=246614 RepID=UPI003D9DC315